MVFMGWKMENIIQLAKSQTWARRICWDEKGKQRWRRKPLVLGLCLGWLMGLHLPSQAQAPFVAATFPQDEAENLDCNFAMTATLNFPSEADRLDPITLNQEAVKLFPADQPDSLLPVHLSYNASMSYLNVICSKRLRPQTTYAVRITDRLADSRGFAFRPVTYRFTTGQCGEKLAAKPAESVNQPVEIDPEATSTVITSPELNPVEDSVQIRWRTEREFLTQHFLVQRAQMDGEFQAIGKVRGAGESRSAQRYFWYDRDLKPGFYLYRILAVDQLGGLTFSDTVVYYHEGMEWGNRLVPVGGELKLNFFQAERSTMVAVIYNRQREVVKRSAGFVEAGEKQKTISLENLPPGEYAVMIQTPQRRWVSGIRIIAGEK